MHTLRPQSSTTVTLSGYRSPAYAAAPTPPTPPVHTRRPPCQTTRRWTNLGDGRHNGVCCSPPITIMRYPLSATHPAPRCINAHTRPARFHALESTSVVGLWRRGAQLRLLLVPSLAAGALSPAAFAATAAGAARAAAAAAPSAVQPAAVSPATFPAALSSRLRARPVSRIRERLLRERTRG